MISARRIDIPTRTAPGRIIKAGYLTKLGGNKQGGQGNWKKRYMVLQDDLKYYDSEQAYLQGGQPKGSVKLKTYYVTYGDVRSSLMARCLFFGLIQPLIPLSFVAAQYQLGIHRSCFAMAAHMPCGFGI